METYTVARKWSEMHAWSFFFILSELGEVNLEYSQPISAHYSCTHPSCIEHVFKPGS